MAIKKIKKRQVLGEVREEKLSSAKINEVIDVTNSITEIAGVLKTKTITLSASNLLNATAVNFDINVAGKIILPIASIAKYNYGTTAFGEDVSIDIKNV